MLQSACVLEQADLVHTLMCGYCDCCGYCCCVTTGQGSTSSGPSRGMFVLQTLHVLVLKHSMLMINTLMANMIVQQQHLN